MLSRSARELTRVMVSLVDAMATGCLAYLGSVCLGVLEGGAVSSHAWVSFKLVTAVDALT
jgi:hypothetical protein